MLAFDRPWALVLLLLVPGLIVLRGWLRRHGASLPLGLDPESSSRALGIPILPRMARLLRELFLWSALAGCVVAVSGPALVTRRVLYLGRGNEVIFILDVSPSMAASDIAPSRIDAAKAIIGDFLSSRRNETVGLVAFGEDAALICPPTLDYGSLSGRLASIQPGEFGEGTAIGAGIATAVAHEARSTAPEKHAVLLTDGENNAGAIDPFTAAQAAQRYGIVLSVIGLGTRGEVPLSYVDPSSGERRSGTLKSGFDQGSLEKLALAGGGQYYAAENKESLAAAFDALSERSASLTRSRTLSSEEPLVRQVMFLALLCLAGARLLGLAGGGGRP
ncbi:MAG TPA: VWA domain-containing protein [Rectinemataceae bacterium]|nr:VWA domain-containing protein [Rectinemataceae bacterium]